MTSLEFPELHHHIVHQLSATLSLPSTTSTAPQSDYLLHELPPLPVKGDSPQVSDDSSPSRSPTSEVASTKESESVQSQNGFPDTASIPVYLSSRQQSVILAGARWALETKNRATRVKLVKRLLPYLAALPHYHYHENYRWKDVSPEDRFVYEFVSYLLSIANLMEDDSVLSDKSTTSSTTLAQSIWSALWDYLAAHIELIQEADPVRLCTFVLPSFNGLLQALEDVPTLFPTDWVPQTYRLIKVLLNAQSLDRVMQKVMVVRRGVYQPCTPGNSSTDDVTNPLSGIFTTGLPPLAPLAYAQHVVQLYTKANAPFSSNFIVARCLGFIRNLLVCRAVQPFHSTGITPVPRMTSFANERDGEEPMGMKEKKETAFRKPLGKERDEPTTPRLSSRGRQSIVSHAGLAAHLDAAVPEEAHLRSKTSTKEPLSTGLNTEPWIMSSNAKGFPESFDECWNLLKAHATLQTATEAFTATEVNPVYTSMDEYHRALRGLFALCQQYWFELISLMTDSTSTSTTAEGTATTSTPPGSDTDLKSIPQGLAHRLPNHPSRPSNGTSVGWNPQVTMGSGNSVQGDCPPKSTPWFLAPDLYVLEILSRCVHISTLTTYLLSYLDEPFLNNTLTFLTLGLVRQCPHVVEAACDALELIVGVFPDYRSEILQALIDYVNHPPEGTVEIVTDASGMVQHSSEVALDDEILGYVVQVLIQCLMAQDSQDQEVQSTLYLFMNTIFAVHLEMKKLPLALRICRNAVIALSDIALALRSDRHTIWCVSTLLQSMKKYKGPLRHLILEKLVQIALVAPVASFVEVMELLAYLANSKPSAEQTIEHYALRESVWQSMRYVATQLNQRPDLYQRFFTYLLNWFVDKGVEIQNTISAVRTKGVIHAKELGVFLPVIQALLEHADFEPQLKPNQETVSLMRNVWFHLVLNGCLVDPSWIAQYNDALVIMAAKSPVLVHESAINYLETDLEYNSVLRRGYSEHTLSSLRQTLASYLPDHTSTIRGLSFAQTTFLLAIWYSETTRGRVGNCTQVLRYFENAGVTTSKLVTLIEAIAGKTLQEYIQQRRYQRTSVVVNEQMKFQLRALLISSCSRLERVSRLSRTFVRTILLHYPQALLDKQLLFTLLELVQLVWESCQAEIEDEFYPVYSFTSLPLGITVQLPDSMTYRKTLLASYTMAARDWLMLATRSAPLEMEGLLQDYLAHSDTFTAGFRPHVGRSLALDVGRSLYAAVSGTLTSSLFSNDPGTNFGTESGDQVFQTPLLTVPNSTASFDTVSRLAFTADAASGFLFKFGRLMYYSGEKHGWESKDDLAHASQRVLDELYAMHRQICQRDTVPIDPLYTVFSQAGALVIRSSSVAERELLKLLCWCPVRLFTEDAMKAAVSVWTAIIVNRPELEPTIVAELVSCWTWCIRHRQGLFSDRFTPRNPFCSKMSYAPSDKTARHRAYQGISQCFNPHITWILFFTARVDATQFQRPDTAVLITHLFQRTFPWVKHLSTSPLARYGRFLLVRLGLKLLEKLFASPIVEFQFRKNLYAMILSWFTMAPRWTFSGNKRLITEELRLLLECYRAVSVDLSTDDTQDQHIQWIGSGRNPPSQRTANTAVNGHARADYQSLELPSVNNHQRLKRHKRLILLLLASEIRRLTTWNNASDPSIAPRELLALKQGNYPDDVWRQVVHDAWDFSASLALFLPDRFPHPEIQRTLAQLIMCQPEAVVKHPEALQFLLPHLTRLTMDQTKYLLYWAPAAPITAASYLTSSHSGQPLVVQYAMRALARYPVDVVFFYIPQLVQALRYDVLGYVEKYIFDAAQISQLFAHQIIWNMKANMYKDEDAKIPDTLKPTLDRMIDRIVGSLSGTNQAFYEREFSFFDTVTGISGKLKPYIKRSKEEKKKKIDEELHKIPVEVGVYLPSNPDGAVVDIDYSSGRPLQSHAKAPFMATFYVKRKITPTDEVQELIDDHESEDSYPLENSGTWSRDQTTYQPPRGTIGSHNDPDDSRGAVNASAVGFPPTSGRRGSVHPVSAAEVVIKQSAIFKVGDDCRQDVLALQLIAIFKNIFTSVGLDLYLFPYRVVATSPGCGMIDVIPNSISRDQLGREKVNSLYDYFLTKYGGEDSVSFQKARHSFVQSVAAYSLVSFLLQIKDRHNGNIMLDDRGHIVHIDFGFILDISPGGINFESSPFKLTAEMINVMGGSSEAQPFKLFADLCVKAYLASRPYAELIVQVVKLVMDSGLPCFKGKSTLDKLRQRFQLDKSDREAAQYMMDRIQDSYQNRRTVLYDSFQKATNGIPY
ncbi:phosphatidylinositol-4- kinase [Dispira simplex]|nr:phosphatidylinositol-4- kinase [Dispira simplex]